MRDISRDQFMNDFGENLKRAIDEFGMTLSELSAYTGISISTLSNYANGLQMPSLTAYINIIHALDLEPEDLVDFNRMVVK